MKSFLIGMLILCTVPAFAKDCKKVAVETVAQKYSVDLKNNKVTTTLQSLVKNTLKYAVEVEYFLDYGGGNFTYTYDRYIVTAAGTQNSCQVTSIKHTKSFVE